METVLERLHGFFGSSLLTRCALACLPLLAGASYASGNTQFLLLATFLIPLLALGIRPAQARPYRVQLRNGGQSEIDLSLEKALAKSSPAQRCAAVVIELDEFDKLLETWGRDGCVEIMSNLTDRLCSTLRSSDVVYQVGKNRFAIALPNMRTPELGAVVSLIERLQKSARDPIMIDHSSAHVTVTAGFCLEDPAPERAGQAMRRAAELALLDANSAGLESIRGFSKNTPSAAAAQRTSGQAVLNALDDGQIKAWFQPQISTDTGQVTGFEALARWEHPEHGVIPPAEFLPALEEAHGMELLSEAMLQQSLKALLAWDAAHQDVASVAVNFATDDLRNPSLIERIKWDVDRFDIEPERLTIEILETVVSETDDDVITRNIRALGCQGYRIDLDDFGTGHASLANIRRFNVDRIKIDRSFVVRADESPDQQRMINAILRMAEQLEIETIAEGVETIGEKSILSQLGCTHMQGYAIAHPMPFDQTIQWLQQHRDHLTRAGFFPRQAS